ncbi:MAG TPA: type IX secretion system membrane protein PorP/SprF [Bacteroidetes bacterium]|nr:type IX secretion system membrane protein PorP/SprF [Bacteroidota bacterium]
MIICEALPKPQLLLYALIFLFVNSLIFPTSVQAQHNPLFSQYMFNGLVLNPAYAGSRDVLSVTGFYRNQWTGFQGAPKSQSFTAHSPLKSEHNNLGLTLAHDQLGVSSHTMLNGSYAYRIDLGQKTGRLAFGIQGGISLLQDRWTEITTDQPGDAVFQANSPTFVVPRVGFGVLYDTRNWFLGASAPFLLDYKGKDYALYVNNSFQFRPYLVTGGWAIRLNPDLVIRPSFLFKYLKHAPEQIDLNANLIIRKSLWLGLSYRSGDALIGMVEFQLTPQLRLGYAYDYSVTELQKYNNGSHEFMLRYEFGYRIKAMSPRYF